MGVVAAQLLKAFLIEGRLATEHWLHRARADLDLAGAVVSAALLMAGPAVVLDPMGASILSTW